MATLDEIGQEKQKVSERLARLDADREKLASQLNELEIAERMLTRFGMVETTQRRGRGRPARPAPAPQRGRARGQPAHAISLSDATLRAVRAHPEGATANEVLGYLSREFGMAVRPNHLGIALQRHRGASRLYHRDSRWYVMQQLDLSVSQTSVGRPGQSTSEGREAGVGVATGGRILEEVMERRQRRPLEKRLDRKFGRQKIHRSDETLGRTSPPVPVRRSGPKNIPVDVDNIMRHLVASGPRTVRVKEEFIINAGIRRTVQRNALAASRIPDLDIPKEGVDVALLIILPDEIEVIGTTSAIVHVLRDADPPYQGFELRAHKRGHYTLSIVALVGARELARVQFTVAVAVKLKGAPQADQQVIEPAPSLKLEDTDAKAAIGVAYSTQYKTYRLSWLNKSWNCIDGDQSPIDANAVFAAVDDVVSEIEEIIRRDSQITVDAMNTKLASAGRDLWNNIIPREIRDHYAREYARYSTISLSS